METQEKTRDEKIASLEHERNSSKRWLKTFEDAARKVASGEEYDAPASEKDKPRLCDEVRQVLGDSMQIFRMMYVDPEGKYGRKYPSEMHREAKRLYWREEVLYSGDSDGSRWYERLGHSEDNDKAKVIRKYYPGVVERAKVPFFERCAKLAGKDVAIIEGELEALGEE